MYIYKARFILPHVLAMHSFIRSLLVFGLLASMLMIYVSEGVSILKALKQPFNGVENCTIPILQCGDLQCCSTRCRVGWGGSFCG